MTLLQATGRCNMAVLTCRQISFDTAQVARPDRSFQARFFEAARYRCVDGSTRVTEPD